jgi:hypothetical protein
VLAGATEPLTLLPADGSPLPEGEVPEVLHPLQVGTVSYVPLLEILRNAGIALVPGTDGERQEVAFSLLSDLYQLSYVVDNEGNVTDLQVMKNLAPQVMTSREAALYGGVFYLPTATATELTQVTFVPDEAATRITVTLPAVPES